MQTLKEAKPKKIIQKRVARRERFARMARIRYRKERNEVIAKVQDLDQPPKYVTHEACYENPLGFIISETEEGLDSELSYLNASYISNSVTVNNDDHKTLCVKLHKNDHDDKDLKEQVLDEWEKRNDPYWIDWAKNFKSFRNSFKQFVDKNKDKFEATKLDEESLVKQKAYAAKRDELMFRKPCLEIRTRFNDKGRAASEIIFNSGFVDKLNYDFEEFIQKILVEGIPRLRPPQSRGLKKHHALYNDFEKTFTNGFEVAYTDIPFMTRSSNVTKMDYSLIAGGYFVKNAAEMSFVFAFDNSKIQLADNLNKPIYRLYLEQQMAHEAEKKYFIEMFYKQEMEQLRAKPREICQIRACVGKIEEESEGSTDKDSTSSGGLSNDLVVKDNVEFCHKPANNGSIVSFPNRNQFAQFAPQMQIIKRIFETQQNMLSHMFHQNPKHVMTKH